MALLFFKKYIIATFFILAITLGLVHYLYKKLTIPYHLKVSDTGTPYVVLDMIGFDDTLTVYIRDQGSTMSMRCDLGSSSAYSFGREIPARYATPYHYIMSGHLDDDIRTLRVRADLEEQQKALKEPWLKQSKNAEHLANLPIKFKDVSHEVRRKLGLK